VLESSTTGIIDTIHLPSLWMDKREIVNGFPEHLFESVNIISSYSAPKERPQTYRTMHVPGVYPC